MRNVFFASKSLSLCMVGLVGVMGVSSMSQGAVVSVQYNSTDIASNGYTAGVVSASGWNSDTTSATNFASETTGVNALKDSTGVTTAINETKSDFGNYGPNGAITAFTGPDASGNNSLYSHGSFGAYGGQNLVLNLSGLNAATTYDLYVYFRSAQPYGDSQLVATNSVNATTYYVDAENGGAYIAGSGFGTNPNGINGTFDPATSTDPSTYLSANYVEFSGLTGVTGLSASLAGSNGANLDGFQLVSATPEPASLSVLGLGAVALLKRRRQA